MAAVAATELVEIRDRARFVPPRPVAPIIARPRLDELYRSARGQIVRVLAPGGFGKSTLVARWAEDDDRSVVWVDVEGIDNNPAVLASTLRQALSAVDEAALASLPVAPSESRAFRDWVIPALGAAVRGIEAPFVLVLDDVHVLTHPESGQIVDAIAKNIGPESTLVLAGRGHRLDASIARLRLDPGVCDLGAADLALDIEQSDRLLTTMGIELPGHHLDFVQQFEGWPAGLRLAGLALLGADVDPSRMPVADIEYVTDYLREEWTSSLDPHDRQFLSEVACLDRCTAEMCDAILGERGSAGRLRRLRRAEQLVIPLDHRVGWFRMHPLLSGWLESELEQSDHARWIEVHSQASSWWELHGDIDLAIEHASRVGDGPRCETLVANHAAIHFPLGAHETARRWLDLLPPDQIEQSARLCALAAMAACHTGHGERLLQWSRRLGQLVGEERDPDDEGAMTAEVVRSIAEPLPANTLVDAALRARDHLPAGPWQVTASFVLGANLFLIGDDRAHDVWIDGAENARPLNAVIAIAHCLGSDAILADLDDDHARAIDHGRRVQEILDAARVELNPVTAIAVAASAMFNAREGNLERAAREIGIARGHLSGFATVGPWFNVLARLGLVRAAMILGDRGTARTLLREAAHHASRPGDAEGAERRIDELRAQLDANSVLTDHPSGALTAAERRVLAYLPTNLSLGDIATKLYVSRNTVKSHAAAIYRKLGAGSRGEAVTVARQAGLVGDAATDWP